MPYKNKEDYEKQKNRLKLKYNYDPEYRESRKKTNRQSYHKNHDKRLNSSRRYRLQNKDKIAEINWRASIKYRFGINIQEYNVLLTKQNGRCAICGKLPKCQRLDIDHNHETGIIRGLLCRGCNRFVGLFENNDKRVLLEQYLVRGVNIELSPLGIITKVRNRKWDGHTIFPEESKK